MILKQMMKIESPNQALNPIVSLAGHSGLARRYAKRNSSMTSVLNNREIATAIWLFLFLLFSMTRASVREAIGNLLKAFMGWQILLPHLLMVAYVLLVVLALRVVHFWDVSALKDTVIWVFGVGIVMLLRADKADESFFKRAVLDNLKLLAVLEFISNAYTFGIVAELIIVPVLTFVAMTKAFAEVKAENEVDYRTANNVLGYVLSIAGLALIAIAFYKALKDVNNLATFHNLRDFLLPLLLTAFYLPFIYGWALFLAYDMVFVRIDIFNKDRRLARYLKKTVVTNFHIRLWRLIRWSKSVSHLGINNVSEAASLINGLPDVEDS